MRHARELSALELRKIFVFDSQMEIKSVAKGNGTRVLDKHKTCFTTCYLVSEAAAPPVVCERTLHQNQVLWT